MVLSVVSMLEDEMELFLIIPSFNVLHAPCPLHHQRIGLYIPTETILQDEMSNLYTGMTLLVHPFPVVLAWWRYIKAAILRVRVRGDYNCSA